jgi:hypothetical protein
MSRNASGLFTLCLLASVAIAPRGAAAGEPLTTAIYERAGVTLDWTSHTAAPGRSLTIVLTTIAAAPAGLVPESMGVAPSPGDGTRGTIAYIFMDRVASFASTHRVEADHVLACAMAHEIGHLLLPPNAHAADGIMRGNWHPALFPPRAPGVPGFPPEQARLLKLRVQSR